MAIRIHNNLTKTKEPLKTIESDRVRMYCCGITVYDYCHLGHGRTCLIWDVVRRYLQWRGYGVTYIQNFTDIDDKILNRARQEGSSMEAVSEKFIQAYFEDMEALHIQPADSYPRATHTLNGIQKLVAELEAQGYAYASDGDVYYSVRKFPEYGKLSGRKLEDLQAGASGRVEQPEVSKKQDPFDFALWKAAKTGEPSWSSPWGEGRPGWHIECSAMVREHLGDSIDIHVGGSDLIFPHHENEIAQSEAVTGQPLAHYWLHSGMVKVEGEKMSKSLGNFITIRQLLETHDPMAVRLFILQAHYSKPLDFTEEALEAAAKGWQTLNGGLLFAQHHGEALGWDLGAIAGPLHQDLIEDFQRTVDDDFNFAGGLAILFDLGKKLQKASNTLTHTGHCDTPSDTLQTWWLTLRELSQILGFVAHDRPEAQGGLSDEEIEALIAQRQRARQEKNYGESDRLRDQLQAQGIVLIDQPGGATTWHRG